MKIYALLYIVTVVSALSVARQTSTRTPTQLHGSSRRGFLSSAVASVTTFALVSSPAFADVADGNQLPDGAAQFSRLLNTKANISTLKKRILDKEIELNKQEWDNIGQFLRRLYQSSEDMKSVAISIYDPEKKKAAVVTMEEVKKYSKAGEASVNDQDVTGIVVVLDKVDAIIADFLELLRDIPDEI
jgi:hypothetical protein